MRRYHVSSASSTSDDDNLTLERALEVAGWPASLSDPSKRPHVVDDVDTFERLLLFGSHVDRILVLRDGIRRLRLGDCLPPLVEDAARGETCVRRFLDKLGDQGQSQQFLHLYMLAHTHALSALTLQTIAPTLLTRLSSISIPVSVAIYYVSLGEALRPGAGDAGTLRG